MRTIWHHRSSNKIKTKNIKHTKHKAVTWYLYYQGFRTYQFLNQGDGVPWATAEAGMDNWLVGCFAWSDAGGKGYNFKYDLYANNGNVKKFLISWTETGPWTPYEYIDAVY